MKRWTGLYGLVLFSFLSLGFVCGNETIVIKGSDTLGAKMVPMLTKAYKAKAEGYDVNFEIAAEGSSSCFKALVAGNADIGMSSRVIKLSEKEKLDELGIKVEAHVLALDMIAVIVNEKNPIKNLSKSELKKIFTGEITEWKELKRKESLSGSIKVYTRNTSSGTYKTFQKLAMNGEGYGKNTQKLAGSGFSPSVVEGDMNGIGYVGLAYVSRDGLKPLRIDGVAPIGKNGKVYPLTRSLYFYTPEDVSANMKRFVEWVKMSKKAAEIIKNVGFTQKLE